MSFLPNPTDVYENIVRLKLITSDGKMRQIDCANRETILRLIQSVPSPSSRETILRLVQSILSPNTELFKLWSALAGTQQMEEIESPDWL